MQTYAADDAALRLRKLVKVMVAVKQTMTTAMVTGTMLLLLVVVVVVVMVMVVVEVVVVIVSVAYAAMVNMFIDAQQTRTMFFEKLGLRLPPILLGERGTLTVSLSPSRLRLWHVSRALTLPITYDWSRYVDRYSHARGTWGGCRHLASRAQTLAQSTDVFGMRRRGGVAFAGLIIASGWDELP